MKSQCNKCQLYDDHCVCGSALVADVGGERLFQNMSIESINDRLVALESMPDDSLVERVVALESGLREMMTALIKLNAAVAQLERDVEKMQ